MTSNVVYVVFTSWTHIEWWVNWRAILIRNVIVVLRDFHAYLHFNWESNQKFSADRKLFWFSEGTDQRSLSLLRTCFVNQVALLSTQQKQAVVLPGRYNDNHCMSIRFKFACHVQMFVHYTKAKRYNLCMEKYSEFDCWPTLICWH